MAQRIANSAWNPGVLCKLNAATRRWLAFCKKHKKPVVNFELEQCLEFLHFLHSDLKLTYYPMRAAKEFLSAVSKFLRDPLTQSDRECIAKYVKSIFNRNPPIPKRPRLVTWNVDVALDFLQQWDDNQKLQLNDLAGKISLLILLSTMCRISDVAQLDMATSTATDSGLEFRLQNPTKCFTENNMAFGGTNLQTLVLRKFEESKLCPVSAINTYIARTSCFRGKTSKLFVIVHDRPRGATIQTISRWTKKILCRAGLDKFTIHSGRAASASCALLLGMPIDSILRHAGWRSKSTFVRRYLKTPMTEVTDRHGFSKNWGHERGERITPVDDVTVRKFINRNQTICCRDPPSAVESRSTFQKTSDRSQSTSSRTDMPSLPQGDQIHEGTHPPGSNGVTSGTPTVPTTQDHQTSVPSSPHQEAQLEGLWGRPHPSEVLPTTAGSPVGSHQLLQVLPGIDQPNQVTTTPVQLLTSRESLTEALAAARLSLHPNQSQAPPSPPAPRAPHRDQEGTPPPLPAPPQNMEMGMVCHQGPIQNFATATLDRNRACLSHQSMGNIWNAPLMTKSGVGPMRSSSPPVSIAMGFKRFCYMCECNRKRCAVLKRFLRRLRHVEDDDRRPFRGLRKGRICDGRRCIPPRPRPGPHCKRAAGRMPRPWTR